MLQCNAKIRPFPSDTELTCDRPRNHSGTEHSAVLYNYAFPGSNTTITWEESDRRTFRGAWPGVCGVGGCVLPLGHQGRHEA